MSGKRYDLVLLNGTVVDGSGKPPVITDVAIRNDRIEHLGDFHGDADCVVDVFGKVVTPGFVDLHGHSDYSLLLDPLARSKIFQGVTTEVGGNCGYHAAPVRGALADERQAEYQASGLDATWRTFAEYRSRLAAARPSLNYAQQMGYNTLRSALTQDNRALTANERKQLRTWLREELAAGAVGLSYGIAYAPACFSTTDELTDAAEEAAAASAFISFHLRNEDNQLIEALEEALHIGRASGAATHIGHLKTFRKPNWGKLDSALELLERYRSEGRALTVDRYPYLAMNTQLKFLLPVWALEGGGVALKQRLRDPLVRKRLADELRALYPSEAREICISLVSKASNKAYEGKFLDQCAGAEDPWDRVCELLSEEGDAAFATFFGMNRDNLHRILDLDYAIVASDASIQAVHKTLGGGVPHPRCFDTFPYFLAEWVFGRGVFSLEAAIRKMTSLPAQVAGLKGRGKIEPGYFADLVVFDPSSLTAEVQYEQPLRFPPGVERVLVNGQTVVSDGKHTGARPGRYLTRNG